MKKLIPLMLLCSLLACWSCELRDSYTQTNVQEMVTVVNGALTTDYGYTLTVTEDLVGPSVWRQEGARFLALFDILDSSLNITLKEADPATKQLCYPYEESDDYPEDPSEVYYATLSGGYINLGVANYRSKTSNFAHRFSFYYEVNNVELTLYIFHDGNEEDITHMQKDQLSVETRIFSLPLENLDKIQSFHIVMNGFSTDEKGDPVVKKLDLYVR